MTVPIFQIGQIDNSCRTSLYQQQQRQVSQCQL